jgi:hypothetical protein
MQLIETKTLASAAASIEFTSIPQTGLTLVVLYSLQVEDLTFQFENYLQWFNFLTTHLVILLESDGSGSAVSSGSNFY